MTSMGSGFSSNIMSPLAEIEMETITPKVNAPEPEQALSPPLETHREKSSSEKLRSHVQFVVLCWTLFLAGWNDGSTGPLLPRIQVNYNIGFTIVSLIFVFACIGFISGALVNVALTKRATFGQALVLGASLQAIGYCLESAAPPFSVLCLGYAINGVGMSLLDAHANAYVSSMSPDSESQMGWLHAVYGLGALSSPLVATQFSQLEHWSFHYLVSLGIALSNVVVLWFVFRFKSQNDCLAQIGATPEEQSSSEQNTFSQIFRLKTLHLLALFIFVYVGVEVTIGGWIVTFIIDTRGGGPSSGYISSGFFGGLMFGRVALLWVNKKVGERRVIYIYTTLAVILEIIIWFVPSLIGNAVAVAIVGVLLGPFYPIAMNQAGKILPRSLLGPCFGWIAGLGQAGSAAIPFLTGAVSSKAGIIALQPILIAMMAVTVGLWTFVPTAPRKTE